MASKLTTKTLENWKPSDKRQEVPDPAMTGLYFICQPSGAKSWAVRYRFAGKPKKLTLGKWPIIGLADARAAAGAALDAVEHGRDPAAAKRAARAERIEAEISGRDKISTLLDQFNMRHLSGLRTGWKVMDCLRLHVLPKWGDRNIDEISRRDVLDLLDGIADQGKTTTANRVRAYLSKFFGWAIERELITASPMAGVKRRGQEQSRDRVLSDDEIRWFWVACDAVGYPFGTMGKLLLLTGQRLGEVAGMKEAEIHDNTWRLPAERVKNKRPHDVPLPEQVLDILARAPRIGRFYFTMTGRTPVSGFSNAKTEITEKMIEVATLELGKPVAIDHWTWHDLRRTCATGLARIGIPVRVTESVLNHVSGTGGGIVAVYQRYDFAGEKRSALEAWSRRVAELVEGGGADNVVRLNI